MPLTIFNGPIIQAGESLSSGIDCSAGPIVKITMPGNWVGAAPLTFQTSSDGVMYNDIFNPDGTELKFAVIAGTGVIGMRLTTGFINSDRAPASSQWCSRNYENSRWQLMCRGARGRQRIAGTAAGSICTVIGAGTGNPGRFRCPSYVDHQQHFCASVSATTAAPAFCAGSRDLEGISGRTKVGRVWNANNAGRQAGNIKASGHRRVR